MKFAPKIFASILYFPSWRNHSDRRLTGKTFVPQQNNNILPSYMKTGMSGELSCMVVVEEDGEDTK